MARSSESGAYLGGISTMLMQTDTCPACGQVHTDSRLASLIPRARQCPLVVIGSMPTMATHRGEADGRRAISIDVLGESAAEALPPLPAPMAVPARKPSGLAVPWPMPSHLEEFL